MATVTVTVNRLLHHAHLAQTLVSAAPRRTGSAQSNSDQHRPDAHLRRAQISLKRRLSTSTVLCSNAAFSFYSETSNIRIVGKLFDPFARYLMSADVTVLLPMKNNGAKSAFSTTYRLISL